MLLSMSTPPDSPYQAPDSIRDRRAAGSFGYRLLRLPISPSVWRMGADLQFPDVALPLLLITFVANLVLGWWMIPQMKDQAHGVAEYYDANADPLVYADGRFSLDGDRFLHHVADDATILIDPDHNVADEEVTSAQYLIVRSDEVIFQQANRGREIWAAEDFAGVFGPEPWVLDGAKIRELADRWVPPVVLGAMAVLGTLGEFIACLLYALVAGLLVMLLRGQWLGLDFGACYRIALATAGAKVTLSFVLALTEIETGLPGILQWPLLMTALGFLALVESSPQPTANAP